MIDIDDIIQTKEQLEFELKNALSKMQRSDQVKQIKMKMIENQMRCPHISTKYNWTWTNECPYCGKVINKKSGVDL